MLTFAKFYAERALLLNVTMSLKPKAKGWSPRQAPQSFDASNITKLHRSCGDDCCFFFPGTVTGGRF